MMPEGTVPTCHSADFYHKRKLSSPRFNMSGVSVVQRIPSNILTQHPRLLFTSGLALDQLVKFDLVQNMLRCVCFLWQVIYTVVVYPHRQPFYFLLFIQYIVAIYMKQCCIYYSLTIYTTFRQILYEIFTTMFLKNPYFLVEQTLKNALLT